MINENVLILKKPLSVLESLCEYEAINLFKLPYIKKHILDKYKQKAYFSTHVT